MKTLRRALLVRITSRTAKLSYGAQALSSYQVFVYHGLQLKTALPCLTSENCSSTDYLVAGGNASIWKWNHIPLPPHHVLPSTNQPNSKESTINIGIFHNKFQFLHSLIFFLQSLLPSATVEFGILALQLAFQGFRIVLN